MAERGNKARGVRWQVVDVAADVFVRIRAAGLADSGGGEPASASPVQPELDKQTAWFMSICDYGTIMSYKSPVDSGLSPDDTREGQMRRFGVLPLGVREFDPKYGAGAVYVLVSGVESASKSSPYISPPAWDFLIGLLAPKHLNRYVVLLGVRKDVFDRAVNYLYYRITIESDGDDEFASTDRTPIPIDVQAGDEPEIGKARYWLRDAYDRRASDVHLEPGEREGRLRLRIDGELIEDDEKVSMGLLVKIITWIKTQSKIDISEKRVPQDGRMRLAYGQGAAQTVVDVRVSAIPTIYGQKVVLRLLSPEELEKRSATGLGETIWDDYQRKLFSDTLAMRDGIVLVTGPTGSGKTTTLNAGLYYLLKRYGNSRNIVTIEDPVEYSVEGVNQVQVNDRAGMTFDRALRSIVRQDPDIVLVGEIRDPETAKIAVQAALTGHLILTTLHTNDALGAVDRLLDLDVSPFLIATTVRLFQAQRLVRKLCPKCSRGAGALDRRALELALAGSRLAPGYRELILSNQDATVCQPVGCSTCEKTGYLDRKAVMEMARVTPPLVAAIEAKSSGETLRRVAGEFSGYKPMIEVGLELLCRGETSLSELEGIGLTGAGPLSSRDGGGSLANLVMSPPSRSRLRLKRRSSSYGSVASPVAGGNDAEF